MMPTRLVVLACAALLAGCASPRLGPTELEIAPGAYATTFDAARDAMVDYGFDLDRVDARAGVITTRAKTTGGLATPWDEEQSTARQELEDLINDQRRRVRITFSPAAETAVPAAADLRELEGPVLARIEVAIDRVHKPGWRVEPTSVQQSRRWVDPQMQTRGMWPAYDVPFTLDPHLAHRIASRIVKGSPGATLVAAGSEPPRPIERPSESPAPARTAPAPTGYWD